jgi:hypothetical protein
VAGPCENGSEPSGSMEGGLFLDCMSDCQLLKKDSALWGQLLSSKRGQRSTFVTEVPCGFHLPFIGRS